MLICSSTKCTSGALLPDVLSSNYYASQTNCTFIPGFEGYFNLNYMFLSDTLQITRKIVNHEFGHAWGLKHGPCTQADVPFNTSVMKQGTPCINTPSIHDSAAVNNIYPDP